MNGEGEAIIPSPYRERVRVRGSAHAQSSSPLRTHRRPRPVRPEALEGPALSPPTLVVPAKAGWGAYGFPATASPYAITHRAPWCTFHLS